MGSRPSTLRRLALGSGPMRPALRALWRLWRRVTIGYRTVPDLPGRIHYNDDLYDPHDPKHYGKVGQCAVPLLTDALREGQIRPRDVTTILDLGCGYGRVLRHLAKAFPRASITACDIRADAVAFCAAEFGARPLLAEADPAALPSRETFDLVWAGSLLSHLAPDGLLALLAALPRLLNAEGIAVLTTHGRRSLDLLHLYAADLPPEARLRNALESAGICFTPYPWERAYGITLVTPAFLDKAVEASCEDELGLLLHRPAAWDAHQDVYAYQRR